MYHEHSPSFRITEKPNSKTNKKGDMEKSKSINQYHHNEKQHFSKPVKTLVSNILFDGKLNSKFM